MIPKFDEAQLQAAIVQLLEAQGYPHTPAAALQRASREVLLKDDLRAFLKRRYKSDEIGDNEIARVIEQLTAYSDADLYASNKAIMKIVAEGLRLRRDDPAKPYLHVQLLDYAELPAMRAPREGEVTAVAEERAKFRVRANNIFRLVTQMSITGVGGETRIPDAVLYVNGLPLVVFEFKSAIREEATIHDAHTQLTLRYRRDIPALFKFNAFCVISDGVNNRVGTLFADYEFFSPWRRIGGDDTPAQGGIDTLHTMLAGLFHPTRLPDVIRNFIFFPDASRGEEKILCRYPQYYAATRLYHNIIRHKKPNGDGKGGTYFGATGCGKSYTMLFLARLLMRSAAMQNPTIVLITDRVDLDEQLARLFTAGKKFIGDDLVVSADSRAHLHRLLHRRVGGGVFLTTIHKFTEDTRLLTVRDNVICISDEAHRSQVNLDEKVVLDDDGARRSFGFAKYLHDSLPNATFVGFSGTPIGKTIRVFGEVVDSYTMQESVGDEITVRIVYEGRAAKVLLDAGKLQQVEEYYAECAAAGASEEAIAASERANLRMRAILGDGDRLKALAADFVAHYEARVAEGATQAAKAMFVSCNREIAHDFYCEVIALRPGWGEAKAVDAGEPGYAVPRINLVMTRAADDPPARYDLLGDAAHRKELARQFKDANSNFKIAVVVDMWLTGFDAPALDTMYLDKPVQRHNLIQTISRVNRTFAAKEKGLVVDYIGIKKQMNIALAEYAKTDRENIEDIAQSAATVKDQLDLLQRMFRKFDAADYFDGSPVARLECLRRAAEHAQQSGADERRFMAFCKRMKAGYDVCVGGDALGAEERARVHFYLAIVFKLNKGDAPDIAQMNARVARMVGDALASDGVEEILKMGREAAETDIFAADYLDKIAKIKLPNTKFKLLQKLLRRAIDAVARVNKLKGEEFAKRFAALVARYNARREQDVLRGEVLEEFTDEIIELYRSIIREQDAPAELGINLEEKAFYDILQSLAVKYEFEYPHDKLIVLAKAVKGVVDDEAQNLDWSQRGDAKARLKVELILLLDAHGYPPVPRDEVYKAVFEQAENFKRYCGGGE